MEAVPSVNVSQLNLPEHAARFLAAVSHSGSLGNMMNTYEIDLARAQILEALNRCNLVKHNIVRVKNDSKFSWSSLRNDNISARHIRVAEWWQALHAQKYHWSEEIRACLKNMPEPMPVDKSPRKRCAPEEERPVKRSRPGPRPGPRPVKRPVKRPDPSPSPSSSTRSAPSAEISCDRTPALPVPPLLMPPFMPAEYWAHLGLSAAPLSAHLQSKIDNLEQELQKSRLRESTCQLQLKMQNAVIKARQLFLEDMIRRIREMSAEHSANLAQLLDANAQTGEVWRTVSEFPARLERVIQMRNTAN